MNVGSGSTPAEESTFEAAADTDLAGK